MLVQEMIDASRRTSILFIGKERKEKENEMIRIILVTLILSLLTLTSCRTYRFDLTDPDSGKTISFDMTHLVSDTEAGKITFTKTHDNQWVIEIENLHTTQKLAATIDSLAALLSKFAVPATAAIPAGE